VCWPATPIAVATWVCHAADAPRAAALLSPAVRARTAFPGWIAQDDLRALYDRHGVFVFPSFYEGFGKAFLEAMARGCCVVASDTGGMRDVITDGRDGRCVPVGDPEALAVAIEGLLTDPRQAQIMSTAARATAEPYTWDRVPPKPRRSTATCSR